MNIALIIAAGSGKRTGKDIPKQFISIYDKPIIIYTLEGFQNHDLIDAIEVVCLPGWHDVLRSYAKQYGITKLKWIVDGGNTAQESIRNGVMFLRNKCSQDDICIIHDGIRPMIEKNVLSDVIATCERCGNGVSALPYNEQIFNTEDGLSTTKYIPRDTLRRVQTPQAYRYEKVCWAYEKAFKENIGIGLSSYANTMMVDLGERLYFSLGSDKNIKITTSDDIDIFKALLKSKNDREGSL